MTKREEKNINRWGVSCGLPELTQEQWAALASVTLLLSSDGPTVTYHEEVE